MKQSRFIRKCGPYEVSSISQDGQGVRLVIFPAFSQYNLSEKEREDKDIDESWKNDPRWAIHRYRNEGGGPNIFTVIGLAKEFEDFLNQPYTAGQVNEWKQTNAEALKKVNDKQRKQLEKAFKKMEAKMEL